MTDNAQKINNLESAPILGHNYLDRLMNSRRSLYPRQFSGGRIDDEIVQKLLEYANTAPNHRLTRPWRFKVFTGNGLIRLIDEMKSFYLNKTPVAEQKQVTIDNFEIRKNQTSHILAIVVHEDPEERVPVIEEKSAVSCAVQNIYLSLSTFELGGYWSTGKFAYSEECHDFLKLADNETSMGFFYLGKVNQSIPLQERENVGKRVEWIRS